MNTTKVINNRQRHYVQPQCDCGWTGIAYPTNRPSIEMYSLAERDAKEHRYAHENHTGFFDYQKGWVAS